MNTVSLSSSMSWGERATTSGIVTLQGMLTIFLVLSLLWVAIEIMHRIIHKAPKTKEEPTEKKQLANANPDAAIAAAIAATLAAAEDDGAIVAAITAAILAARAEEGNATPFRVVSFKRANARKKL